MSIRFGSLPVCGRLRITSGYGPRNTGIAGASTFHKGIDLGRDFSQSVTPILAVADGVVTNSYYNKVRGWVVILDHGGFKTLYQHLAAKGAAVGSIVRAGARIGTMGKSSSTLTIAVHLHFELIANGVQIDPEGYIRGYVMTMEQAKKIIKEACKFEDSTIQYLDSYIYRDALLIKIAKAIQGVKA